MLGENFIRDGPSLVVGHWSVVAGHWPLAAGHWQLMVGFVYHK
jgi:hypothetical protein